MIARRRFLMGAALAALGCEAGSCDKDSGLPTTPDPVAATPSMKRAPSPIGYSNVATLNSSDVRAVWAAGGTLVQAEMIPFVGRDGGPADWEPHFPRIKAAVATARGLGMTSFLTLVNDNSHAQREQSDRWFRNLLDTVIREIGPQAVWLEGVSEPRQDSSRPRAERWMKMAIEQWPGLKVANGKHGPLPSGYDLVDWHYCSYRDLLEGVKERSDRLHSTDCTPALASNLNTDQIIEVVREAAQRKRKLILYDTFNAPAASPRVIDALRQGLL